MDTHWIKTVNVNTTKDGRGERREMSNLLSKLSRPSEVKLVKGYIAFVICIAASEHTIAFFFSIPCI